MIASIMRVKAIRYALIGLIIIFFAIPLLTLFWFDCRNFASQRAAPILILIDNEEASFLVSLRVRTDLQLLKIFPFFHQTDLPLRKKVAF